jgi:hypothetical protein
MGEGSERPDVSGAARRGEQDAHEGIDGDHRVAIPPVHWYNQSR